MEQRIFTVKQPTLQENIDLISSIKETSKKIELKYIWHFLHVIYKSLKRNTVKE